MDLWTIFIRRHYRGFLRALRGYFGGSGTGFEASFLKAFYAIFPRYFKKLWPKNRATENRASLPATD
jgi:hypothetical protein